MWIQYNYEIRDMQITENAITHPDGTDATPLGWVYNTLSAKYQKDFPNIFDNFADGGKNAPKLYIKFLYRS